MSTRKSAPSATDKEEESKRQFNWTWKQEKGIVWGDCGTKPSAKVVGLDMDGTIIRTKSNAKFAKDAHDWVIWDDKVIPKLKEFHNKGYKIVIMTNQGGIEKGHTKQSDITTKIENICEAFGFAIQAFISPNHDSFHKPSTGMWDFFAKKCNGSIEPDLASSFYIGDAAGRPKTGKRAADFENTDYKFGLNIGCQFQTPESFFLGEKDDLPELEFDPRQLPKSGNILKGKDNTSIKSKDKEMIIFVGSPGIGKSTFWKNHLPDYVRVNNDTLKTKEKCMALARESCKNGKSVVIDNTNPEAVTRKLYIDIAKEFKYPVRCFYFDLPKHLALHNDNQRETNKHRTHLSKRTGKIPIHSWYKKVEPPKTSEGFASVEVINFVAGPFTGAEDEKAYFTIVSGKK